MALCCSHHASSVCIMINLMHLNKHDPSIKPESLSLHTALDKYWPYFDVDVVSVRAPCQLPVEAKESWSPWKTRFRAPVFGRAAIKIHSHCQLRGLCCSVTILNCGQADESLHKQGKELYRFVQTKTKRERQRKESSHVVWTQAV